MRSAVDRICSEIQRHLRVVSRDGARPQAVTPTIETPQFPAGLGDARMRFELERYFSIHCTSFGFDDTHADDIPAEESNPAEYNIGFEFVDPESLRVRPSNLSLADAYRWDTWALADNVKRAPSPAEIDYCSLLARLDRANSKQLRQDTIEGCKPGLLDQFAPTMTNSPGRPPRRAAPTFANSEVTAR